MQSIEKLHEAEAGTLEHWSSEEEHNSWSVDHMKTPSVFNEFIELSSKLDALGLFFARLLSGSQRHWFLCLEWGACALAEWGVNVRAWAA